MNQYHKLYTPEDSAVVFIDHQPQMLFGVANADRATLINNVTLLAQSREGIQRARRAHGRRDRELQRLHLAAVARRVSRPAGRRTQLHELVGRCRVFAKPSKPRASKNILMTGLWTEVCVTWPTIEMLGAGYNIYVVEDCCGATSPAAQEAALSRMVQAGAVRLTTIAALLEWQRDWKNREHYNALMGMLKQQAGAYGVGVEYAYTMVHHAPQSAQKPQVVPKKAAH